MGGGWYKLKHQIQSLINDVNEQITTRIKFTISCGENSVLCH